MRSSVLVIAVVTLGCSVTLHEGRTAHASASALSIPERVVARCMRSVSGAGHVFREPLPGPVTDPELLRVLERFPAPVRHTAAAAGLETAIARLLLERERSGGAPTPAVIEMRLELAERMSSLPGQLLAAEFECECIVAAIEHTLKEYEDDEASRQMNLTIASLVAGAAFGLASGVWDLANSHAREPAVPDGPVITGIAGAVVTTGLGAATLVPHSREVVSLHRHNLLAPIVRGTDDDLLFPTFVFRMLTTPAEPDRPTPRDELLTSWRARWANAVAPEQRAVAERIVYGQGGVYDPALLELRQTFHEELEATLDSLSRHIDELGRAVASALAEPAAGATTQVSPPAPPAP